MTWFKICDTFADHPKLAEIPDDNWAEAVALWVAGGCYCARHLTDGRLPRGVARRLVPFDTNAAICALTTFGLWDQDSEAFYYHDWAEYQPARADVEAKREAARDRMRHARSRNVRANTSRTKNEPTENFARSSPNPDPSRPVPELTNVSSIRARVVSGFQQRWETATAEPLPASHQPTAAGTHISQVVLYFRDLGLDPTATAAAIDRTLDAFFAADWVIQRRFKWRFLADDTGQFTAETRNRGPTHAPEPVLSDRELYEKMMREQNGK